MGIFASQSPGFDDDLLLIDSTPVECARSRETVKRLALADAADYGWCGSHSRYFWGFRLHAIFAPDGTPRALELTSPKRDERDVALVLLERCRRHGGETLLGDKGYAGRAFAAAVSQRDATFVRPRRNDEPGHGPHLAPIRQRIESIFWTCKDLLTLERHGARTLAGLRERILARFCCLAADHPQPPTRTAQPCTRQLLRLTARNQPSSAQRFFRLSAREVTARCRSLRSETGGRLSCVSETSAARQRDVVCFARRMTTQRQDDARGRLHGQRPPAAERSRHERGDLRGKPRACADAAVRATRARRCSDEGRCSSCLQSVPMRGCQPFGAAPCNPSRHRRGSAFGERSALADGQAARPVAATSRARRIR
jgi:hypothetical protein